MATYIQIMNRFNQLLEKYNQTIRIIEYNKTSLVLSNGLVLNGKKCNAYKSRFRELKSTLWIEYFDKLMSNEITEHDIKHMMAVSRGKKAWNMHSDSIRKNLNTGIPWSKGKPGIRGKKHTDESKKRISIKNSGMNNGMYGYKMSDTERSNRSECMKKLILDGKFTPNTNNRFTHRNVLFNGKLYRSSWEVLYQHYNPNAEYEKLRISYSLDNKNYVYIVDFIDNVDKLVIEVKPQNLCSGDKWNAKLCALTSWTNKNNYRLLLVDQSWIVSNIPFPNLDIFDSKTAKKIRSIYETFKKNRNR